MKKYSIFTLLCMLLSASMMTSCLKDQEDLFEESSSKRLTNYLAEVQTQLMSAENGWVLDYFPDREQSYGGFVYVLKFDDQQVEVACELGDSVTDTRVSLYRLCNESGPCIVFDTYNDFMHYFATPSGSSGPGGYEAYDGDFYLLVLGISDDKNTITLKGTRSGNVFCMHRLTESGSKYLEKVQEMNESYVSSHFYSQDGRFDVTIDLENRQIAFVDLMTQEVDYTAYVANKEGGLLYRSVAFNGREVTAFSYDTAANQMVLPEAGLTLEGIIPPLHESFLNYAWYLSYDSLCSVLQKNWAQAAKEFLRAFTVTLDYCTLSPKDGMFDIILGGQYHTIYALNTTLVDTVNCIVNLEAKVPHPQDVNVNYMEKNLNYYDKFNTVANGKFQVQFLNKPRSKALLINVDDPTVYYIATKKKVRMGVDKFAN